MASTESDYEALKKKCDEANNIIRSGEKLREAIIRKQEEIKHDMVWNRDVTIRKYKLKTLEQTLLLLIPEESQAKIDLEKYTIEMERLRPDIASG